MASPFKQNVETNFPGGLDVFDAGNYDPAIALAVTALEAVVATGALLTFVSYAPASPGVTYSGTAQALAAVDATNLTVSFVAPTSGTVLVRQSAIGYMNSATFQGWWGIVTHGTSTVVGVPALVTQVAAPESLSTVQVITGLTSGQTYQWDWAFGSNNASGTTHIIALGSTGTLATPGGPAAMEVWVA